MDSRSVGTRCPVCPGHRDEQSLSRNRPPPQLSGFDRGAPVDSAHTWEGGTNMSKILNLQKLASHVGEVEPAISISSCDSHSC